MVDACDFVIVGGGPAGLAASIFAASEGLRVTLIECQRSLGGQAETSSKIVNYLGFPGGISGEQLVTRARKQLKEFGVRVEFAKVSAVGAKGNDRLIQLEGGHIIVCKSALIACGVQWRTLDITMPSFGVFYGANPGDAKNWANKDVVVVGGANSAGQAAVHFAEAGARVTVISRSPLVKSMSAYLISEIARHPNATCIENAEIKDVVQLDHDVRLQIHFKENHDPLTVDGIFIFIGAVPMTSWLDVVKDDAGYVLTGSDLKKLMPHGFGDHDAFPMETSVSGVFAAGDVRHGSLKRVSSATGEGAAAVSEVHQYLASLK